ncbi:hypothetical protein C1645_840233 [Glomus cerebriforme]|uniref:Uncharacterized protein n=1 Tax=Glomus cerebriforme TaxID=658196 RepID=A0A397S125_9GLOM|nr:hypothetical protein C1645_840233 [Glomus cerebriforme]
MGGGSSNGSSPVSRFSVRYWKVGTSSPSSSVRTGKGKRFSELFSPEWEGKTVLCAFGSILKSETVLFAFGLVREIGNDSPLVRALGIRKWFLDFISGSGFFFDFSLEIWFAPGLEKLNRKFGSGDSESETFDSGNSGLEM